MEKENKIRLSPADLIEMYERAERGNASATRQLRAVNSALVQWVIKAEESDPEYSSVRHVTEFLGIAMPLVGVETHDQLPTVAAKLGQLGFQQQSLLFTAFKQISDAKKLIKRASQLGVTDDASNRIRHGVLQLGWHVDNRVFDETKRPTHGKQYDHFIHKLELTMRYLSERYSPFMFPERR